jgi:hypothetical protein
MAIEKARKEYHERVEKRKSDIKQKEMQVKLQSNIEHLPHLAELTKCVAYFESWFFCFCSASF